MSLAAWVLVGLAAAAAVMAIASVIPVLVALKRLQARVQALKASPFVLSLMSLQMQSVRFTRAAERAQSLSGRGAAAIAEIEASLQESGVAPAREAMEEAGADISALLEDLR